MSISTLVDECMSDIRPRKGPALSTAWASGERARAAERDSGTGGRGKGGRGKGEGGTGGSVRSLG